MAHEEFEIEISPQGKVTVRTKGIKGPRCLDFAKMFAEIIGREESRKLTSEYYEQPNQVHERTEVKQRRT